MNRAQQLRARRQESRFGITEYWHQLQTMFGGNGPVTTTFQGEQVEPVPHGFEGYTNAAYKANGIVFGAMAVRFLAFSEINLAWQRLEQGQPTELFYDRGLEILRRPWPKATTKDLLRRMILDADLAGNFYAVRRRGQVRRLRPDWVYIVIGSNTDTDEPHLAIDAHVIGYIYAPPNKQPEMLDPSEVVHFAPYPDPMAHFRGVSWLTPVLREIDADSEATAHKLAFFRNAATPNMAIKFDPTLDKDKVQQFIDLIEKDHSGSLNAWKTMYLGGGADPTVVGQNFQQLDFRAVQGAGETRIAVASGVPAVILGISEGLAGSSLNAGNYGQSIRRFRDMTMHPLWRDAAGSLTPLVREPPNAELWYDPRGIPWLQEDRKDLAEIHQVEAQTIRTLVDGGWKPESVIAAMKAGDWALMNHTGLVSVQMQEPGQEPSQNGQGVFGT